MKTYSFELCAGRHTGNMQGIFPKNIESMDARVLERRADEIIPIDCEKLELYVTGFAMAVLSVVKVCVKRNIRLTAYNYNPKYHMYTRQEVL